MPDRLVLRIATDEVGAGLCHVFRSFRRPASQPRAVPYPAMGPSWWPSPGHIGMPGVTVGEGPLCCSPVQGPFRATGPLQVHACETAEGRRTMTAGAVHRRLPENGR